MRKISLLLVAVILLGALFLCSCEVENNYVYELNESGDGYIVSIIVKDPTVSLTPNVVPYEYKGLPVTEIKDGGFAGWSGIFELVIPSNIEIIGTYAFGTCESLLLVEMSEGVKRIEEYAFANNLYLNEVELPSTVEYIGKGAFGLCPMLSTIVYSGTIEEWNAIEKAEGWYEGSALTNGYLGISCTDGNVLIKTID